MPHALTSRILCALALPASFAVLGFACGSSPSTSGRPQADGGADGADGSRCADAPCGKPSDGGGVHDSDAGGPDALPTDTGPPPPTGCLPFTMPSDATLFGAKKKVFAHYFYPFPLSIDNQPAASDYYETQYLSPSGESNKWLSQGGYLRSRPLPVEPGSSTTFKLANMEREVRAAIATGITGFTVDILGTDQTTPGSQLQDLLAAAAAVDPRFKIVVMPDMSALPKEVDAGALPATVEAVVTSVATNSAALHLPKPDDRLVVSAFAAEAEPPAFWTSVLGSLAEAGAPTAFVPVFLGWEGYASSYAPFSYGFGDWGTATPSAGAASEGWPKDAHTDGRIFMMPVDPEQYRPKDFAFWEAGNSGAFRAAWTAAIAGGSDWVQLVTWSDFSESSQVEPYTDATLSPEIGTGFYDLNAYYAAWFLTGAAPTITRDVLFWFYRREPTTAAAPAQGKPTTCTSSTPEDDIELLAFLTAPGTLSITLGGSTVTKSAPAGVTSFTTPLAAGTPKFGLSRGGATLISFDGGVPIVGASGLASGTLDLTYWSGSASTAGTCAHTLP